MSAQDRSSKKLKMFVLAAAAATCVALLGANTAQAHDPGHGRTKVVVRGGYGPHYDPGHHSHHVPRHHHHHHDYRPRYVDPGCHPGYRSYYTPSFGGYYSEPRLSFQFRF